VCLLISAAAVLAQPPVNQRSMYERVMAIVPVVGTGTAADPKRPLYAPVTRSATPTAQTGIIGFTYVLSDDGNFALVEFVARQRTAFATILADTSVQTFLKGQNQQAAIVAAFSKLKKNFDINHFGVRLP
jgi:hypothetical protein